MCTETHNHVTPSDSLALPLSVAISGSAYKTSREESLSSVPAAFTPDAALCARMDGV